MVSNVFNVPKSLTITLEDVFDALMELLGTLPLICVKFLLSHNHKKFLILPVLIIGHHNTPLKLNKILPLFLSKMDMKPVPLKLLSMMELTASLVMKDSTSIWIHENA